MTYTVTQLITRAWYLSGIVPRGQTSVSGDQINDGLALLNAVLSFKTSNGQLIPYYAKTDFTLTAGNEAKFFPNLIHVETLTFNIGPVRYPLTKMGRFKYWGSARVDNIQSIPYMYETERVKGGTNLYTYFLPVDNFPATLFGKFALVNVALNQDLETNYDDFYIEYLRYALAEHMCCEYNVEFLPQNMEKLLTYENRLYQTSPPDITMEKFSTFQTNPFINYAYVNLSGGWVPP